MSHHSLRSRRTAEDIERRVQMEDETLVFTTGKVKYAEGDAVTVTSCDGGVFTGEITDVAEWSGDGEYLCCEYECGRLAPHLHISLS